MGSQYILILAAENLVRKLLSYAVGFLIADLSRRRQNKGKKYAEWDAERKGTSWKAKLKAVIDDTIPKAKDFEDFLRLMEAAGYEIKRGKYVSFRAPGQERFTRSKTLGEAYTVEAITERIAGKAPFLCGGLPHS